MDTGIKVKITSNNECLFDKSIDSSNNKNNKISNLAENLKVMQQQVNDFMTTLIESQQVSSKGE